MVLRGVDGTSYGLTLHTVGTLLQISEKNSSISYGFTFLCNTPYIAPLTETQ